MSEITREPANQTNSKEFPSKKKYCHGAEPAVIAHNCDPSTQQAQVGGL